MDVVMKLKIKGHFLIASILKTALLNHKLQYVDESLHRNRQNDHSHNGLSSRLVCLHWGNVNITPVGD